MIAGLPEDLLDALADAWKAKDRERTESLLKTLAEFHRSNWMTKQAVAYLLGNADVMDRIGRRTLTQMNYFSREEFDSAVVEGVRDATEFDYGVVAKVIFWRLRAMFAEQKAVAV
jgi:hypothetical protein